MNNYSAAGNKKVFLLSDDEFKNYCTSADRIAYPNSYCLGMGCYTWNNGACSWWLRDTILASKGRNSLEVTGYGEVNYSGRMQNTDRRGIRPAIWVKIG